MIKHSVIKQKTFWFKVLFFCCIFILSSVYIDWSLSWNAVSRVAMPLSIVTENRLEIDSYAAFTGDKATINDHYYSDKSPLPGFLMIPVLCLADIFFPLASMSVTKQLQVSISMAAFLFGVIPFVFTVWLMFVRKWKRHRMGVPVILLFFFGSFLFIYVGSFYSSVLGGFFLVCAYFLIEDKKYLFSGVLAGASFLTEYTLLLFAVVWGLYWLFSGNYKNTLFFTLGVFPFIFVQAWYNQQLTGLWYEFAYKYQENFVVNSVAYGFSAPSLKALYHLTLSPYRGLLFYAPLLIFFIVFSKNRYHAAFKANLVNITILAVILYVLLFSMSKSWYGGWSFGPRYLYVVPILLLYLLSDTANFNGWRSTVFYALAGMGCLHTIVNKATILYPTTTSWFPARDLIIPALKTGQWNEMNLFSAMGVPGNIAFFLFAALFSLVVIFFTYRHRKIWNKNK